MKTLYLLDCISKGSIPPGKYFAIGVKNQGSYSLETFQSYFPNAKIERLVETYNHRYMHYSPNSHILQPAFITIPKEKKK